MKLSNFPQPLFPPDVAQGDWICGPCGATLYSDPLPRSNFDALCDILDGVDPLGTTWEIVRFDHWAVGWLDSVFVKPGSAAYENADFVSNKLKSCPCLDEELMAQYIADDAADDESDDSPEDEALEDISEPLSIEQRMANYDAEQTQLSFIFTE